MTTMRTLWLALIAVFVSVTIGLADAEAQKRLGGGKNIGKQAPSNVTQRDATPPASPGGASAASAAPAAPAAAAARPGAAAAPAAAGSRWMAPLAGIAAGLGLAALASWMGFGEELATILLIALVVLVVLVAVRMVMARRSGAGRQPAYAGGHQYSGLGQEAAVPRQPAGVPAAPSAPVAAASAAVAPEALATLPAGFDVDGFVRHAKVYFVRLQAAFDAGDTDDLREFTSPEMFAELKMQIDERQGASNQTDVVALDARLLGVETVGSDWLASVRFSGQLREQPGNASEPFDEVWNFARPVEGKGGWVLGGIQQLSRA
jgi:predicted lipid-binding transport protein (Tim44 family)